ANSAGSPPLFVLLRSVDPPPSCRSRCPRPIHRGWAVRFRSVRQRSALRVIRPAAGSVPCGQAISCRRHLGRLLAIRQMLVPQGRRGREAGQASLVTLRCGGYSAGRNRLISRVWPRMSFGTRLFTMFYGELVGNDEFGNKYYVDKRTKGSKRER